MDQALTSNKRRFKQSEIVILTPEELLRETGFRHLLEFLIDVNQRKVMAKFCSDKLTPATGVMYRWGRTEQRSKIVSV